MILPVPKIDSLLIGFFLSLIRSLLHKIALIKGRPGITGATAGMVSGINGL